MRYAWIAGVLFEQFLKCCVTGLTQLTIKRNGYFTFQTIIDKPGARSTISFAVCVGSPVIILQKS